MVRAVSRRFSLAAFAAAFGLAVFAGSALGFGTGGKVLLNLGGVNSPAGLLQDSHGRLIVPASSGGFDFAVARFTPGGAPDTSFSGDGKVSTDIGSFDSGNAGVVTKGDKIVLGGFTNPGGGDFQATLLRYKPDGTLDPSFSGDGVVTLSSPGGSGVDDIAAQHDGKLVVAGSARGNLMVARLKTSGKLDHSFSGDGIAKLSLKSFTDASGVAIQRNGQILVTGSTSGASITSKPTPFIAAYRPNGSLDRSFGKKGLGKLTGKGFSSFSDIALTKNGTIYVAGDYRRKQASKGFMAAFSFKPNGGVNRAFSKDGRATVLRGTDSQGETVLIQRNGRVVVGGRSDQTTPDWLLARFSAKGKLDHSFSHDGTTTTDFSASGDVVAGLVEQGKGKIVGGGLGDRQVALARYKRNGSLDG